MPYLALITHCNKKAAMKDFIKTMGIRDGN